MKNEKMELITQQQKNRLKEINETLSDTFILVAKWVDDELGIEYYIASYNEQENSVLAYVHEIHKNYWQQLNIDNMQKNPNIISVFLHNETIMMCNENMRK